MPIMTKAVKASRMKVDAFRLEALNALRKTGTGVRRDYRKTTRTWKGDKPKFEQLVSLSGDGPTLVIEVTGGKGALKWFWLDQGTEVRYATMSSDWISKTRPGRLRTVRGRGVMLFVSKSHPRDGIKPRYWTAIIVKTWTPRLKRNIEAAMRRARDKSGHAI